MNKFNAIRIEDLVLGQSYKLSINPASQPVSLKSLNKWYSEFTERLRPFVTLNSLALCLESSPTGRLHFHGIIEINDMREYLYLVRLLELIATFDIDYIDSEQYWFDYCIKQDVYFESWLLQYPLLLPSPPSAPLKGGTGNNVMDIFGFAR